MVSSLNCSDSICLSMAHFPLALKLSSAIQVWPESLVLWTRFLHFSPRSWQYFWQVCHIDLCNFHHINIYFGPELKTTDLCQFYFTLWKLIAWAVGVLVPSLPPGRTPPYSSLLHCSFQKGNWNLTETKITLVILLHLKSLYWSGLWMDWCVQRTEEWKMYGKKKWMYT